MSKPLTDRQAAVYEFIKECIVRKQRPPTLREIMVKLGIGSTNGVFCHISALESKGYIERDDSHANGIRLTKFKVQLVAISGGD